MLSQNQKLQKICQHLQRLMEKSGATCERISQGEQLSPLDPGHEDIFTRAAGKNDEIDLT